MDSAQVTWNDVEADDLDHYAVHGSSLMDFSVSDETLLSTTENTEFMDDTIDQLDYYYTVLAVDIHGNVGDVSTYSELMATIGDINFDMIINVLDVVLLVELIIDINENDYTPSQIQLQLSDLYADGNINVVDIVVMINIIFDQ